MKTYRYKKEFPITAVVLLLFFLAYDYFNPGGWNNIVIEIAMKLLFLGAFIAYFFTKVVIRDDCIEYHTMWYKRKLLWKDIIEITNHPIFQISLKLIPSKESREKTISIPFTFIEGSILNEINSHVSPQTKRTIYFEKE